MEIIRNPDGGLVVPIPEARHHDVAGAPKDVTDSEASGEALRYVLVGGTHSVEVFSEEVAKGGRTTSGPQDHQNHW